MTDDDAIRQELIDVLLSIAPELDAGEVEPEIDLREDLELDSMDFLNFVIGVSEKYGVDIPESDYAKVSTLNDCVAYLRASGV